jgi:hypothetical protein
VWDVLSLVRELVKKAILDNAFCISHLLMKKAILNNVRKNGSTLSMAQTFYLFIIFSIRKELCDPTLMQKFRHDACVWVGWGTVQILHLTQT